MGSIRVVSAGFIVLLCMAELKLQVWSLQTTTSNLVLSSRMGNNGVAISTTATFVLAMPRVSDKVGRTTKAATRAASSRRTIRRQKDPLIDPPTFGTSQAKRNNSPPPKHSNAVPSANRRTSDDSPRPSSPTRSELGHNASGATTWESYFAALVEYKNRKGHMIVPKEEKQLFRFVKNLRQNYKNQPQQQLQLLREHHDPTTSASECYPGRSSSPFTLTAERIQQLESICFSWNPREEAWRRRYEELRAYWEAHGHADLPPPAVDAHAHAHAIKDTHKNGLDGDCSSRQCQQEKDDQYKDLRSWVFYQRQCYRNKNLKALSEEQIRLLEEIDFRWTPNEETWWKQFRELKAFRETHGHFRVRGREYHRLRLWKNTLRGRCKEYVLAVAMEGTVDGVQVSGLNPKRIEALRRVGFCWFPPARPGPLTESPPEDIFEGYQ